MQARGQKELATSGKTNRFLWTLLVVLVPLLSAVVMAGVAAQLVGVPVLKTAEKVVFGKDASKQPVANATASQLRSVRAQLLTATEQNQRLQAKLAQAGSQMQRLSAQLRSLQSQAHAAAAQMTAAKEEAAVLIQMDPTTASGVLAKMPVSTAAQVISQMSPTDSGPIIENLAPTTAVQILALIGQDSAATSAVTGNATGAGNVTP